MAAFAFGTVDNVPDGFPAAGSESTFVRELRKEDLARDEETIPGSRRIPPQRPSCHLIFLSRLFMPDLCLKFVLEGP